MDQQNELLELLKNSTLKVFPEAIESGAFQKMNVQPTKNPEHGDLACSIALGLAKPLKQAPLNIASQIVEQIDKPDWLEKVEVFKPGFINCWISSEVSTQVLKKILDEGESFGTNQNHAGKKAMIEFVSANPTGPLHVGHARNAVVGDTVANILTANGWDVTREYYFNDGGVQMINLGLSLRARYLQRLGVNEPFPENGYKGDYIIELAEEFEDEHGDSKKDDETEFFSKFAAEHVIKWIEADLEELGIKFDIYTNESEFYQRGKIEDALAKLRESGLVFDDDGATWIKSTEYGDEKDRVIIKSDGNFTYLMPDIAYHANKAQRGFDRVVNVWGADHKGYVARLKAGIRGLGYSDDFLDCLIIQMVAVVRENKPVKLSTRSGDFITIKELLDEFGSDVLRFFMIMRSYQSQFTFDLDLAKDSSDKNPVLKMQYAHARVCSILQKAKDEGCEWQGKSDGAADLLNLDEEKELIKVLSRYPEIIERAANELAPHVITNYLLEVANAFNTYYSRGNLEPEARVILKDKPDLTQARLLLAVCMKQVIANALGLLGVSAPEKM